MKTHENAKALAALAKVLREGPNIDLDMLSVRDYRRSADKDSVPIALTTLVALAQFDKSQWQEVIREYRFPVEVRARDASRDILGKILKHLEESPEARNRLANQASMARPDASPELVKALQTLLKK